MTKTTKYKCPCCGKKTIEQPGNYEICPTCGWEDDPSQSKDPDMDGGANSDSLNAARAKWQAVHPAPKRVPRKKSTK